MLSSVCITRGLEGSLPVDCDTGMDPEPDEPLSYDVERTTDGLRSADIEALEKSSAKELTAAEVSLES